MIEAELKNKIPKLETWEDILTSNVFGLLELLDYKYLVEIIKKAKNINKDTLENRLINRRITSVELWKKLKETGEPDILITLDDDTFFIIEVKYFSPENNKKVFNIDDQTHTEKGQLAKYFNLRIENKSSDFIVYLTADYLSLKNIENSNSSSRNILDNIFHIHWNDFNEHLIQLQSEGIEKKIINKITQYLDFKGFKNWQGFQYKKESYDNINTQAGGFYAKQ